MGVTKKRKKEFLEAVVKNNGGANVTQIRAETGFTRNQIDYWFPRVVEDELVEKEYDERDRREAVLTDKGRTEIQKGEFGGDLLEQEDQGVEEITLSKSEFNSIVERVERVEQQNQAIAERIRELEENQSYILEGLGVLQLLVQTIRQLLSREYDLIGEIEEVEEELMDQDDHPPSLEKYRKERYED